MYLDSRDTSTQSEFLARTDARSGLEVNALEEVLEMPRRKALEADQWKTAFDEIVADATKELGRVPCMALEETEDGNGALLVASVTIHKTPEEKRESQWRDVAKGRC